MDPRKSSDLATGSHIRALVACRAPNPGLRAAQLAVKPVRIKAKPKYVKEHVSFRVAESPKLRSEHIRHGGTVLIVLWRRHEIARGDDAVLGEEARRERLEGVRRPTMRGQDDTRTIWRAIGRFRKRRAIMSPRSRP
jgi:hypothetical protein